MIYITASAKQGWLGCVVINEPTAMKALARMHAYEFPAVVDETELSLVTFALPDTIVLPAQWHGRWCVDREDVAALDIAMGGDGELVPVTVSLPDGDVRMGDVDDDRR